MNTDRNEQLEDLEPQATKDIKGGTWWKDRRPVEGLPEADLPDAPEA